MYQRSIWFYPEDDEIGNITVACNGWWGTFLIKVNDTDYNDSLLYKCKSLLHQYYHNIFTPFGVTCSQDDINRLQISFKRPVYDGLTYIGEETIILESNKSITESGIVNDSSVFLMLHCQSNNNDGKKLKKRVKSKSRRSKRKSKKKFCTYNNARKSIARLFI